MTQKTFLAVTRMVGEVPENITRIEVDNSISAGIRWQKLGEDLVPIYEEHSARLERGFSLEDWEKMPSMEKAIIVAVRRIDHAAKNLQAEAESKHMKSLQKRGNR